MRKVRIKLDPDTLVDKVTVLVEDLLNLKVPARVEREAGESTDTLVVTIPWDMEPEKLVELGMFIQRKLC